MDTKLKRAPVNNRYSPHELICLQNMVTTIKVMSIVSITIYFIAKISYYRFDTVQIFSKYISTSPVVNTIFYKSILLSRLSSDDLCIVFLAVFITSCINICLFFFVFISMILSYSAYKDRNGKEIFASSMFVMLIFAAVYALTTKMPESSAYLANINSGPFRLSQQTNFLIIVIMISFRFFVAAIFYKKM